MEDKLYLCVYPYYRDFTMNKAYKGDVIDRMTGTSVKQWSEINPDHWQVLVKGVDFI